MNHLLNHRFWGATRSIRIDPWMRSAPAIHGPFGLHRGIPDELRKLARLRNLDEGACWSADKLGSPLFGRHRDLRAWILLDDGRVSAEACRLDDHLWTVIGRADTPTGSTNGWLIGLEIRPEHPHYSTGGQRVALVEGCPDYLEALHWAVRLGSSDPLVVAVPDRRRAPATGAGDLVGSAFEVWGLRMRDGSPASDLNATVRCHEPEGWGEMLNF